MVYADLHVHTDNSDGQLRLSAVPAAARRGGVAVVAITDHDRLHPGLDAPVVEREGITLIHGIELRVHAGIGERVDLLGYGARKTPALSEMVDRLQRDRMSRGWKLLECVEDRLGVELDLQPRRGIGRPHVARAIDRHPDSGYDYAGAFEHLIGDDGPCYVARDVPTFEEGREVLAGACDVVGLAHPLRYDDPAAALALTADLDAVERYYPYESRGEDADLVDRALADHDLVATGGSDAHDDVLGRAGLDPERYRAVAGLLVSESTNPTGS